MKRSSLILVLIVLTTGTAFGQSAQGTIGLFTDATATSCEFVDEGGLVQVHFVHMQHDGTTASQWKLDLGGLPWTHLGDSWNAATSIGSSTLGISLGYGACMSAPTHLGFANFFGSAAPNCARIQVVPDPGSLTGEIEAVDCTLPSPIKYFPEGGVSLVNTDENCGCYWYWPPWPTPVETTTWGQVKALYRGGPRNSDSVLRWIRA